MTKAQEKQVVALSPLDDPAAWATPAFEAPLDMIQIARLQATIDSICGVTKGNKSISRLVWNGDRRYWKDLCLKWDTTGEPIEWIKRPFVLYRTVRNAHGEFVRDEFPPRWLILTRIEPEQFTPTWERDSKVFLPDRNTWVQVRPTTPPDEMYVWFMTIAQHDGFCCQKAAGEDRMCYGNYAHPNKGIEELRMIRKGMEERGIANEGSPFDAPDRLTQKLRDRSVNNYIEQSLKQYDITASRFIDALPFGELKKRLIGGRNQLIDQVDKELKGRIL